MDEVSHSEVRFPYTFFEPGLQGMITGGAAIGDKPKSYHQPILVEGAGAGVNADQREQLPSISEHKF